MSQSNKLHCEDDDLQPIEIKSEFIKKSESCH